MVDDLPKVSRYTGKRNRPLDTAWRQQNLSAFRPILTVGSTLPFTIITGLVFCGVGIICYFGANESLEEAINYTNCQMENGTMVDTRLLDNHNESIQCSYILTLKENFTGDVRFYYKIDPFYQNHRLYLNSRNDLQLMGKLEETTGCEPFKTTSIGNNSMVIPYAPCGTVANSMFNDTFKLYYHFNGPSNVIKRVPFTANGMISSTVIKRKFKNPTQNVTLLCDAFKVRDTMRPTWWSVDVCRLGDNEDYDPIEREYVGYGFQNVDFMIWMQPAALPSFRKLYRLLDRKADDQFFADGLPMGNYTLVIRYNYPATAFKGTKSFVIARETWIGARKSFLGIAYMTIGTLLLVISTVFLIIFLKQRLKQE
uniref:Cell cycle control protein 50A n=1 Tax=Heterorhabditis bacteriophora TaxID=37862 RepID=A0A1I7XVA0_HETBA